MFFLTLLIISQIFNFVNTVYGIFNMNFLNFLEKDLIKGINGDIMVK